MLTIGLNAGTSTGTDSCSSSGNFRKSLPAARLAVKFTVKKMNSRFRPDNPTVLCFEGEDGEACYERVP